MNGFYKAPKGVWASSPQRKALYALHAVLFKLEKADTEQTKIDSWVSEIEKQLLQPVDDFDWQAWYRSNATEKRASRFIEVAPDQPRRFLTIDQAGEVGRQAIAADPELRVRAEAYNRTRFAHAWKRVHKDDRPNLPAELVGAWDEIPKEIRDKLWPDAGEMRAAAEGLPFDPADLAAGLDATFHQVKGVTETTEGALRRMMKLALEEAEGPQGFERILRREFKEFAGRKAYQVAVTEWARAASTATLTGYRKTGVQYKRWFTFADQRVCDECDLNESVGEIPINSMFPDGNDSPPGHPECRCSVSSA